MQDLRDPDVNEAGGSKTGGGGLLALSCIYCTTSFGEIKMFINMPIGAICEK